MFLCLWVMNCLVSKKNKGCAFFFAEFSSYSSLFYIGDQQPEKFKFALLFLSLLLSSDQIKYGFLGYLVIRAQVLIFLLNGFSSVWNSYLYEW